MQCRIPMANNNTNNNNNDAYDIYHRAFAITTLSLHIQICKKIIKRGKKKQIDRTNTLVDFHARSLYLP